MRGNLVLSANLLNHQPLRSICHPMGPGDLQPIARCRLLAVGAERFASKRPEPFASNTWQPTLPRAESAVISSP